MVLLFLLFFASVNNFSPRKLAPIKNQQKRCINCFPIFQLKLLTFSVGNDSSYIYINSSIYPTFPTSNLQQLMTHLLVFNFVMFYRKFVLFVCTYCNKTYVLSTQIVIDERISFSLMYLRF